jgi:hypothetical protein
MRGDLRPEPQRVEAVETMGGVVRADKDPPRLHGIAKGERGKVRAGYWGIQPEASLGECEERVVLMDSGSGGRGAISVWGRAGSPTPDDRVARKSCEESPEYHRVVPRHLSRLQSIVLSPRSFGSPSHYWWRLCR